MSALGVAAPWQWHPSLDQGERKIRTGPSGAVRAFRGDILPPAPYTPPRRAAQEATVRVNIGTAITDVDALTSLREILKAISVLQDLPEDWDGAGSIPPTKGAIARARLWLATLFTQLLTQDNADAARWLPPMVSDSADGGVMLEWWVDRKKLTLYIWEDHNEYVKVWGPNMRNEMQEGSADSMESFMPVWSWLTR